MESQKLITVQDRAYGFSLQLPAWWEPYIVVRKSGRISGSEHALRILFRYEGVTYGEVLSVLVFKMSLRQWKQAYGDSPLAYIGTRGGRVYAYSVPEELPYAFVDPDTGEYDEKEFGEPIRLLKKMVNQEVPQVIASLRWTGSRSRSGSGSSHKLPEPYLAAGVTPGDSCGC